MRQVNLKCTKLNFYMILLYIFILILLYGYRRLNLLKNDKLTSIRTSFHFNQPNSFKQTGLKLMSTSNEPQKPNEVLTPRQKLKKAIAEYGTTVIVFHISISLISLGTCYLLVSSGLDVPALLTTLNLKDWAKENSLILSNAGTFALAYAIHKVFAPVRIAITLGSVPFIVRYLRSKGILKK
ncbi:hypothetical protein ABEB36_003232 [Hypothenemus hampei]|uniref:DUF1279 domain-containing protein n=1 Tax=Hypothenemus hampei TaxID=57062 RepID=A0ABD1FBM9_HYPHA